MSSHRKPTLFMTLEDTLVRTCETRFLDRKPEFASLNQTSVFLKDKKTTTQIYLRPSARNFVLDIQDYLHLKIVSHYSNEDMVKICINLGLPYEDDYLISLHPKDPSKEKLEKAKKENSHRRWILFDNGYCPEYKFNEIHPSTNKKFWSKNEYRSPFILKNHASWDLDFHVLSVLDSMGYFKSTAALNYKRKPKC